MTKISNFWELDRLLSEAAAIIWEVEEIPATEKYLLATLVMRHICSDHGWTFDEYSRILGNIESLTF